MQFKCKKKNLSKPQFSSIWRIDRTLSGATTPSQSGPGSDVNEGVLHISQSSSITIRLFSVISGTLVKEVSYPFAEKQSVYSTAPADWATYFWREFKDFERTLIGWFYDISTLVGLFNA